MTTFKRWSILLPAVALIATACGGSADEPGGEASEPTATETTTEEPTASETEASASETETEEPVTRAEADLVIWADETRAPVITPFAEEFGEQEGITVAVQEVDFGSMQDLVTTQGPAGEGPDVFIGAHDWLGGLVTSGVVTPLDLGGSEGDYLEAAVTAFNYEGQNYGLPYAIENIALIRNADLVPETPASFQDMVDTALALQADGTVEVPLGWQQPDVYHDYWVVTAEGGYVFGRNDDGSYDPEDVGIDSEGGLAAAETFAGLVEQGAISQDVTYDVMIESFAAGNAPFAITGPWALGSFSDVNYVVEPLPTVDGGEPQPFVGVQGFMVSSFAENELAAKTFVLDFMSSEDAQLKLYEAGGRPPALQAAFDTASSDPDIKGFGEAGANGYPMPAIPAMGSVWTAWGDAYTLILQGEDATEAFTNAADQIRTLIAEG
jgi:arabinogalactan oligomer/maltooligosaccharide transport system substrate-binding protein